MTRKRLFYLLILALLIRLGLAYFQYSGDVKNHLAWGTSFLINPIGFYFRDFPGFNDPNYPSLAIYLFAASRFLYQVLSNLFSFLNNRVGLFPSNIVPLFATENMQIAFMKLPAIVADIGIGAVLFKLLEKLKYKKALLLTCLFLFNPAIIYISTVWGQIESITLFFLVLSLYASLFSAKKHRYLSLVFFVLAALSKQTALWFTPLYLLLWYKELDLKQLIKGLVGGLVTFFISYLPFGLFPVAALTNYLSTLSGSSDLVSDAAFNLWWFFYPTPTSDSTAIGIFTVRQISIFLLLVIILYMLRSLLKSYSRSRLLNMLYLWSLAVFFFQTRVHERHLAPALVFALLSPGLSARLFIDYVLISGYHMYNLYSILKLPFV